MKSLLLPLDGSPQSKIALKLAIETARQQSARLRALGIMDLPGIHHPEPVPIGGSAYKARKEKALVRRARKEIAAFLSEFRTVCAGHKLDYDTRERVGEPYVEIALEAQFHDLIVMSRETHFHFATQDEPGDTLRHLVRHSPRPLLLAPTALEERSGVVAAFDESLPASRTLQMFQLLGLQAAEPVHLISIDREKRVAQKRCLRAARFLELHGRKVVSLPIDSHADPTQVLLQQLEEIKPGLLVMGSFGQSGLRERLFGSTSSELLFESDCLVPIFLYH